MVSRAFCLALLVFCLAASAAAPKPAPTGAAASAGEPLGFGVEPVPSWVVAAREDPGVRVDSAPWHYRVIDDQIRLDDKGTVRYGRRVRVVNTAAGLGTASQIELDFDPTYQTLVIHRIDIVRNGKRSSRLDRRNIQLLQRETQLERRMVDGRATASIVLNDVRAGDQIDYAFSIRGANPVFGKQFVDVESSAASKSPTLLYQFRLLAPAARSIAHRVGSPDIQVTSRVERGVRETIFRRESVPQMELDPGAGYSAMARHLIEVSEFADWSQVARWGAALFDMPKGDADGIEQKAREIRAASADPEQRLLAALHLVQADVRYFGKEAGLNSHQPVLPAKVLAQRFGDCKDKVGLLIALLARLDIPATPVLVSTFLREQVDTALPSPLAFDHVIARVELGGKVHWLDATHTHQTGRLENRQALGFIRGLPLTAQTTGLAALPAPFNAERMAVRDVFRVTRFDSDVALESRITYRGDIAELVREAIAAQGLADVERDIGQPYARIYPKLKVAAPLRVEPSDTDDAVTLVQSFTIADFWRFPEEKFLVGDALQWSLVDAIRTPPQATRRDPYAITFPGIYRHTTVIEYPEDMATSPTSRQSDSGDARVKLRARFDIRPRNSEVTSEVQILTGEVAPKDWPAYTANVQRLLPAAGLTFPASAISLAGLEKLRRDLKTADDDVRNKKVAIRSRTQAQALSRYVVLSAQLAEDRLTPALRAQALTSRGIQLDNLARPREAAVDFEQALVLAPEAAETLNAAAVNASQTENYARSIELANRLLARNANDTEARNTRALAYLFSNDPAAARADIDILLRDDTQIRRGYALIWLSILSRPSESKDGALARFADHQLPTDWPRPIVDWARGKSSVDALIASAKSGGNSDEQLCEAYYYIGERYLADGDKRRATEYFRKVVDLGITEFTEDSLARNRLAALAR